LWARMWVNMGIATKTQASSVFCGGERQRGWDPYRADCKGPETPFPRGIRPRSPLKRPPKGLTGTVEVSHGLGNGLGKESGAHASSRKANQRAPSRNPQDARATQGGRQPVLRIGASGSKSWVFLYRAVEKKPGQARAPRDGPRFGRGAGSRLSAFPCRQTFPCGSGGAAWSLPADAARRLRLSPRARTGAPTPRLAARVRALDARFALGRHGSSSVAARSRTALRIARAGPDCLICVDMNISAARLPPPPPEPRPGFSDSSPLPRCRAVATRVCRRWDGPGCELSVRRWVRDGR
jgi:hypothetical protein